MPLIAVYVNAEPIVVLDDVFAFKMFKSCHCTSPRRLVKPMLGVLVCQLSVRQQSDGDLVYLLRLQSDVEAVRPCHTSGSLISDYHWRRGGG